MQKSSKKGLVLFISLAVILFCQAVWWIAFMAQLTNEKVEIATNLGADKTFLDEIQKQEISRQIMIGLEGVFFLTLVFIGALLIYRALRKNEELQFHQQNFLMAVTHELKTPLAAIKIYIDTLLSEKISIEKKKEIIPRIKDDVKRLEKMVENILDAGRFDRKGYHMDKTLFNLSELIEKTIDDFSSIPFKTPIKIKKNIQPDLEFYGDSVALRRAIDAILENSLKYNDKEEISLDVSFKIINNNYALVIKDNGIGLQRNDCKVIFNRFYRVGDELRRSKPGSGLGLYLSREIIQAHNGSITAQSEGVGKGTKFNIIFKKNNNGGN